MIHNIHYSITISSILLEFDFQIMLSYFYHIRNSCSVWIMVEEDIMVGSQVKNILYILYGEATYLRESYDDR